MAAITNSSVVPIDGMFYLSCPLATFYGLVVIVFDGLGERLFNLFNFFERFTAGFGQAGNCFGAEEHNQDQHDYSDFNWAQVFYKIKHY